MISKSGDELALSVDIDASLVTQLVTSQFPQWADLPITPVEFDGRDNRTFRLGVDMSVRLPSAEAYAAQVEKEHRWLPILAPRLPLEIPVPWRWGAPPRAIPGNGPSTVAQRPPARPLLLRQLRSGDRWSPFDA
jgi:hypothetical protein